MKENGKQWFAKEKLEKWFRRDNLIVLVLSGVLLFIIALPTGEKTTESAEGMTQGEADAKEFGQGYPGEEGVQSEADYAAYLENKLESILQGVEGVGKVSVMVTLVSSEELVVEKDVPLSRSDVKEEDASGGNRQTAQMETMESTVYQTEGSNSTPYVVKRMLPKVEGILIVAQGAGNGNLSRKLSETAQALFGVEAHKIKVMKMENVN